MAKAKDCKGGGVHLALLVHHVHCIFVLFQVKEFIFGSPNWCGKNSHVVRAGVEHPIPNPWRNWV